MRQTNSVVFAIILSSSLGNMAFGQTSKELQTQFARLQDTITSDDASVQLEALCHSDPNAIRFLADQLPSLIVQATPATWYNPVWRNSVHLAGELKITEAVPVLVKALEYQNYGGITSLAMADKLEDDPAAAALAEIGGPAINPVRNVLENAENSQYTRFRAAMVLYNMNSPDADAALRHDLQTEQDQRLRSTIEARLKRHTNSSPH